MQLKEDMLNWDFWYNYEKVIKDFIVIRVSWEESDLHKWGMNSGKEK